MSGGSAGEIAESIDARDLICPLPVLKARKALKKLDIGQVLEVLATDPAANEDFKAFCEATDHTLMSVTALDGEVTRFLVVRG
ncbi:MAG: sulfurtransferase TusA family protein [Pseudomonadota bacterium]